MSRANQQTTRKLGATISYVYWIEESGKCSVANKEKPSSEHKPGFVSLKNLDKSFGDINAVANLNLDVAQGEFFPCSGRQAQEKPLF